MFNLFFDPSVMNVVRPLMAAQQVYETQFNIFFLLLSSTKL